MASHSKIGLDIVQPVVPEYRVALFEGLNSHEDLNVSIQASSPFIKGGERSVTMDVCRYFPCRKAIRLGPFLWQCGVGLICAQKPGDVLVICGDLTHLSNYWLILLARVKGVGIVWWGHHRTAFAKAWKVKLRLYLTRMLSDVVLCYTDAGIRFLVDHGFDPRRVFATGNTINQAPILQALKSWNEARVLQFISEQSLVGKQVLLFSSMLRPKARLDLLIRAMATQQLNSPEIVLAVVGDGEMKKSYAELAHALGVSKRILWLGCMLDQQSLAPWFLCAKVFVYPGAIGLSIIHAFSYGLPVITHGNADHQMPEFEAMVPGETGLCYQEGDSDDLARQVSNLLADEPLRMKMSEKARRVAFEQYAMARMVVRFKETVMACSDLKRAGQ